MLSLEQMVSQFRPDPSREYQLLVGFEYEVQLFKRPELAPLAYDGDRGLAVVLAYAAQSMGGRVEPGTPPNKATLADGSQLSLEPGGQFELSSAPVATFMGCLKQLWRFVRVLQEISERFDVHVFFGGANPVHTVDQIGLVIPSERYRIMDAYFPRVGRMGRRMMRQTCSLQVTFDYRDGALGTQLLRSGSVVAPIAAGLFANAPFIDGRPTEYRSYRLPIWQDTDSARCGPLPGVARPLYGFGDYVQHVVRAPMFFVPTEQGLVDAEGMTFEQFNREGFGGRSASIEDFMLHNSTIFTDVRLKHTVEVRSVDAQDPALVPGVLAFMCGLLLCEGARRRTLEVLENSGVEPPALGARLAQHGPVGQVAGRPVRDLLLYLIKQATEGLLSCFEDGRQAGAYLDPVADLVRRRLTPADVALDRSDGDARRWLEMGRTFEDLETP